MEVPLQAEQWGLLNEARLISRARARLVACLAGGGVEDRLVVGSLHVGRLVRRF